MKIKKMLLLASMALVAIAVAAPAAQAKNLTFNSETESYEGFLQFHKKSIPTGTFGCQVTITVVGGGGTTAEVTEFEPTTGTCVGSGVFQGCVLTNHTTNVPFTAHTTTNDIVVTKGTGTTDMLIHNFYHGCVSGITTTLLPFGQVTVDPNPLNGPIHTLQVTGLDTSGTIEATGTVTAEGATALTLTP